MSKKIKFVTAKLRLAEYTGVLETDLGNIADIGLLADGLKIEADIKTKDVKPYGYSAKVFGKNEIESAKITSKLIEINSDKLVETGLFELNVDKYVLKNPNKEYLIVIEETEKNTKDEKLQFIFYPCVFTGKFEMNYDEKNVELPLEYTVYADESSEDGTIGMYFKKLEETQA